MELVLGGGSEQTQVESGFLNTHLPSLAKAAWYKTFFFFLQKVRGDCVINKFQVSTFQLADFNP
jgi:hypothetical protein